MSKILIVEDNERTRRMLMRRLTKLNHVIFEAENGMKAIERLKTETVDIILLDQMMPDMDGMETFEQIKEQFQLRPPVIMMTAHATLHLAVEFLKSGGDDFIQKPLDFDILDSKIQRVIETNSRLQSETLAKIRAEESLAEERHLLQTIIGSAIDFIYAKDLDGRYILTNASHAQSVGKTSVDEVIGKTTAEIYSPEQATEYTTDEQIIFDSGQSIVSKEEYRLDQDGQELWLSTTKVPLQNKDGEIIGVVGISRNITEEKKAEVELQKSKDQITIALEKEKELNVLKARFMSMISHEFRTPLSIISMSSQILDKYLDNLSSEKRNRHLTRIINQIVHLNEMVDNIVTTVQAETNALKVNLVQTNLKKLGQTIIQELQASIGVEHRLTFNCADDLEDILADNNHLRIIFTNLLSNAIKYSPKGKEIKLNLFQQDENQVLQVSDEGIGISPDDLARLFEPYHRAEDVGHIKGIGLGLPIVKDFVELHSGRIEVESNLGKGTTFTVFLPATPHGATI